MHESKLLKHFEFQLKKRMERWVKPGSLGSQFLFYIYVGVHDLICSLEFTELRHKICS